MHVFVVVYNESFISTANLWEIAIKVSLGKLSLGGPYEQFIIVVQTLTERMPIVGVDEAFDVYVCSAYGAES